MIMRLFLLMLCAIGMAGCGGRLYTHTNGTTVGLCLPVFGVSEEEQQRMTSLEVNDGNE